MSLLEKFIISEIKKISEKEKLNFILKEDVKSLHECSNDCSCECKYKNSKNNLNSLKKIDFEDVEPKKIQEELEQVKIVSEELNRMKEILSFNNPFLK